MIKKYILHNENGEATQTIECPEAEISLYGTNYLEVDESFEFEADKMHAVINGELVIADKVKTLDEVKLEAIATLKASMNYEESVEVDGVLYKGGYESAQKLDSKRRLAIESNGTSVHYVNALDEIVMLTLEEAKDVCLAVAEVYETKFYYYKTKKNDINNCITVTEVAATMEGI